MRMTSSVALSARVSRIDAAASEVSDEPEAEAEAEALACSFSKAASDGPARVRVRRAKASGWTSAPPPVALAACSKTLPVASSARVVRRGLLSPCAMSSSSSDSCDATELEAQSEARKRRIVQSRRAVHLELDDDQRQGMPRCQPRCRSAARRPTLL